MTRVVAAGGQLVLVTGRPIRWLHTVYAHLPVRPLAVCANGAAVYDPDADALLHSAPLPPAVLVEACGRLRGAVDGVRFAVEVDGGRSLLYEPDWRLGEWEVGHPSVRPVHASGLLAQPAAKLLVRADGAGAAGARTAPAPDEFTARVGACLAGIAEATHSSGSGMVEVSAAGVTKAAGLAWVAERLGVSADDVVAFGDMPNDLPMLAWAGRGVAMANGHPAVRAAADEVTAGNDADGVAVYLERLLAAG